MNDNVFGGTLNPTQSFKLASGQLNTTTRTLEGVSRLVTRQCQNKTSRTESPVDDAGKMQVIVQKQCNNQIFNQ